MAGTDSFNTSGEAADACAPSFAPEARMAGASARCRGLSEAFSSPWARSAPYQLNLVCRLDHAFETAAAVPGQVPRCLPPIFISALSCTGAHQKLPLSPRSGSSRADRNRSLQPGREFVNSCDLPALCMTDHITPVSSPASRMACPQICSSSLRSGAQLPRGSTMYTLTMNECSSVM